MQKIVICSIDLSVDASEVFNDSMLKFDDVLTREITDFGRNIVKDGGEIFKQEHNIIATSEGYFLAFYENEICHA